MAGPIPRTRSRRSSEPNAPQESRYATILPASDGPTNGKRSISFAVARSRSISSGGFSEPVALLSSRPRGCARARFADEREDSRVVLLARVFECVRSFARLDALSTAAICSASRCDSAGLTGGTRIAFHARSASPHATIPRHAKRARRSAGVGTNETMTWRHAGHVIVFTPSLAFLSPWLLHQRMGHVSNDLEGLGGDLVHRIARGVM